MLVEISFDTSVNISAVTTKVLCSFLRIHRAQYHSRVKRKRTKGSKKRRIDSLAKTLNIFIRKNAIKLGNDATDNEKHTQTRKLLRQAYKGTLRSG